MDGQFSLELADALLGGRKLGPLGGRQARDVYAIDVLLPSPEVDGLRADAQIAGQIGDPSSSGEEIEYASAKLGRIPASSPGCLLWWTAA